METKTTLRFYLTPNQMFSINRTMTAYAGKVLEYEKNSNIFGGSANLDVVVPQEDGIDMPYYLDIRLLAIYSKDISSYHIDSCSNLYCCSFHNSQKFETN